MPDVVYEGSSASDPSQLSEGWRPAFLVEITEEDTPPDWERAKRSPRQWRWHFAVWENQAEIARSIPEAQSTTTSKTFSPGGGKFPASTAYLWHVEFLGRRPAKGEHVNLDPLMPLPCRLKISRTNKNGEPSEYANIKDLERWADGQALLTPDLKDKLATWHKMKSAGGAPRSAPAPAPTPPPPAAPTVKPTW